MVPQVISGSFNEHVMTKLYFFSDCFLNRIILLIIVDLHAIVAILQPTAIIFL